jgi:hypothetical protein
MGEVWRARDSVLGREVALKTLPLEFVQDAERLARFEREARLLAAVSHPNIGAIYGLETHDEERFLVLELIEGETLAERLYRGALPVAEALRLALQLAEALEAAHEKGVVHRDLKPSNIKLTPDGKLKVLDFGLAKALARDDSAHASTMHRSATGQGVILGTAAYMAPEQARGEPAGVRADVWAFGCMLYEMLTGKGTFDAPTVPDLLANVLKAEPNWQRLPPKLHPRVRDLLVRCLEKEPRNRYAGISDARVELEKVSADPGGALAAAGAHAARPVTARWVAAATAVIVVAMVAGGASLWSSGRATDAAVLRFSDPLRREPTEAVLQVPLVDISRDGTRVAYAAGGQIFVRDLDDAEARPVQGVTGIPFAPRFSPDGEWLAYAQGPPPFSVRTVPLTGGAPQTVVRDLAAVPHGLDWAGPSALLFVQPEGIVQVPIEGGESQVIVRAAEGEAFSGAHLLPGGEAVLFTVTTASGAARWDAGQVVMQSLRTGERSVVWRGGSDARYVTSGHLVYAQGTSLSAVPFELSTGEVTGSSVTVIEGVTRATGEVWSDTAQYAVSDNGILAYLDVPSSLARNRRELVWVKRDGSPEPIPIPPDDFTLARVSPDGTQVALVVGDNFDGRSADIWILDVRTNSRRRLTFELGADGPVWSHDSSRLYFRTIPVLAKTAIHAVPAEGGTPELIAESPADFTFLLPSALSQDGQTMLLMDFTRLDDVGIATLTLRDGMIRKLFDDARSQLMPSFAPNGTWIAYHENTEEGGVRLNMRPFPDVRRGLVPLGGGMNPVFSRDGSELFYFNNGGLSVASVEYEPSLRIGAPQTLFGGPYWYGVSGPDGGRGRAWDAHPDGRFLMIKVPNESDAVARLQVVVNWSEELRQRAPVR